MEPVLRTDQDPFDLVLRNARILDPSQGLNTRGDLGIRSGKIASVGGTLPPGAGRVERDLAGRYLCPGLIDLHGHWYEGSAYGLDPAISLNSGVTTAIDAGTTGFINFEEFRRNRMVSSRARLLAFLNVAAMGIPTFLVGELEDLRYARPVETAQVISEHPEVLVGVKIREGAMTGANGIPALERALEAANTCRVPLMVHIGKGAPTPEILRRLRPGDIVTHCFQGRGDGIVFSDGMIPEAVSARREGVIFDVGHGSGSFRWETARRAFEFHFYPDTISTDLHRYSVERWAMDMPTTMSKFLHMGMSLEDVILKSTWAPAKAIGREQELGTLRVGAAADLFVFELEEGDFALEDAHLRIERAGRRIRPVLTVKDGEWIEAGSLPIVLRTFRESDLEVIRYIERSA